MTNNVLHNLFMEAAKKGDIDTIKYLVEQGADYKIKDDNLDTIFSLAAKNGHIEILRLIYPCRLLLFCHIL